MARSLYAAAAGLKAQQQNIDTIANNIANINTSGFRKSKVRFKDAIYSALNNPAFQENSLRLGHGTTVAATMKDFSAGALQMTGRSLDLALVGEGFFYVENAGGMLFTRDGTFQCADENGSSILMTANGGFVLDADGQRISSDQSLDGAEISSDGAIYVDGRFVANLGVYHFANPDGLESAGSKSFLASSASGPAQPTAADVRQGFLEGSNVELAGEMTDLIAAQRAYAFLSRAITTADQMKSTANDIRR